MLHEQVELLADLLGGAGTAVDVMLRSQVPTGSGGRHAYEPDE